MSRYLILLRGINVGGKNKLSMQTLKTLLEEAGYKDVTSYINSGNILLSSDLAPPKIELAIEELLPAKFELDSEIIKIKAISPDELAKIVKNAPKDFGTNPDKFYSDVLFPMDIDSAKIAEVSEAREGVDSFWDANDVVYYQRLGSEVTKSKLSKLISKPIYKSITIRNWNTVTKLNSLIADERQT